MGTAIVVAATALALGLVGGLGVLGWRAGRRRRQAMQELAATMGWAYAARDDAWARRWPGAPFGVGDARQVRNVVTGVWRGREVVAFDYSYQTSTTDGQGHRTTTLHRFGVCALALPAPLPRLQVTPERALTRIGRALGVPGIELESEEFNRSFRITCPDPRFASDVLHPRTMELLLAEGDVAWRVEGSELLCWDAGQQRPAQVLERLDLLAAIADGVPSFVWRDRGVAPERAGEFPR